MLIISLNACPLHFQPSLVLVGKAYPRVEHLKGVSLGKVPAFLAIIKLGGKGLPRTYTLAYYKHVKITELLNVILLNVIMLSVIMLSVVEPVLPLVFNNPSKYLDIYDLYSLGWTPRTLDRENTCRGVQTQQLIIVKFQRRRKKCFLTMTSGPSRKAKRSSPTTTTPTTSSAPRGGWTGTQTYRKRTRNPRMNSKSASAQCYKAFRVFLIVTKVNL
jgi:hypothetical protein